MARLFRAIAFAQCVHATKHLRALGGVGDTVANLDAAIGGENYEVAEMYPAFDAVAKLQEEKAAIRSIHYALETEKIHELMYGEAKGSVETSKDIPAAPVFVCPMCGHTVVGDAPEKCSVCGLPHDRFANSCPRARPLGHLCEQWVFPRHSH